MSNTLPDNNNKINKTLTLNIIPKKVLELRASLEPIPIVGKPIPKKTVKEAVVKKEEVEVKATSPHRKKLILSRSEHVKDALSWLRETFPNTFRRRRDKIPLKIGINKDVLAYRESIMYDVEVPSVRSIRRAINLYTMYGYKLSEDLDSIMRVDLDGNIATYTKESENE